MTAWNNCKHQLQSVVCVFMITKMAKQSSNNKDLLLCENKFFLDKCKPENLFNFKAAEKKDDKPGKDDSTFKTEKLTSNGLLQMILSLSVFAFD